MILLLPIAFGLGFLAGLWAVLSVGWMGGATSESIGDAHG